MKLEYYLYNTSPSHFDSAHKTTPKKTCFPFSSFLKYVVLMSIVIVYPVEMCCPCLVVIGCIFVTGGAGKPNKLFRFINYRGQQPLPEIIGTSVLSILKIITKECLKHMQTHGYEIALICIHVCYEGFKLLFRVNVGKTTIVTWSYSSDKNLCSKTHFICSDNYCS